MWYVSRCQMQPANRSTVIINERTISTVQDVGSRSTTQLSSRMGCPLDECRARVMCAAIGRNGIDGRGVYRLGRRSHKQRWRRHKILRTNWNPIQLLTVGGNVETALVQQRIDKHMFNLWQMQMVDLCPVDIISFD